MKSVGLGGRARKKKEKKRHHGGVWEGDAEGGRIGKWKEKVDGDECGCACSGGERAGKVFGGEGGERVREKENNEQCVWRW